MSTIKEKGRNQLVDVLRGIAMLLVVLGHTMTGCIADAHSTFLYNIVWSLQMPLFFLISGYVTRYSKPVVTVKNVFEMICRRTLAYILPWSIWSIIISGFLFRSGDSFNFKYLIFHLDTGYWFLVVIWIISIMHIVASYASSKIKKTIPQFLVYMTVYVLADGLLLVLGRGLGMSFMGIKYALYYSIFYLIGRTFARISANNFKIESKSCNKLFCGVGKEVIVAICTFVYLYFLTRYHLFNLSDGIRDIIIRFIASLAGCVTICSTIDALMSKKSGWGGFRLLEAVGVHSIEIYLTHYLLLTLIQITPSPEMNSIEGASLLLVNFIVTIVMTWVVITILEQNRLLKYVLYGKK